MVRTTFLKACIGSAVGACLPIKATKALYTSGIVRNYPKYENGWGCVMHGFVVPRYMIEPMFKLDKGHLIVVRP